VPARWQASGVTGPLDTFGIGGLRYVNPPCGLWLTNRRRCGSGQHPDRCGESPGHWL